LGIDTGARIVQRKLDLTFAVIVIILIPSFLVDLISNIQQNTGLSVNAPT
jgi:uncharacterized protein YqhQ